MWCVRRFINVKFWMNGDSQKVVRARKLTSKILERVQITKNTSYSGRWSLGKTQNLHFLVFYSNFNDVYMMHFLKLYSAIFSKSFISYVKIFMVWTLVRALILPCGIRMLSWLIWRLWSRFRTYFTNIFSENSSKIAQMRAEPVPNKGGIFYSNDMIFLKIVMFVGSYERSHGYQRFIML